jgi:hypothetical protein
MKFIALVLAVCFSFNALAEGTDSDVPLIDSDEPKAVQIFAGEAVDKFGDKVLLPEGVFLNKKAAIAIAQSIEGCEAESSSLKESVKSDTQSNAVLAVVAVVAAVLGAGLGVGGALILKK